MSGTVSGLAVLARPTETPRSGRPARGEIDIRKQRVLDVATELFIRHGFADTTLDAIGRGAGVAKRTIYHHIGDKEAVFRAIFNRRSISVKIHVPDTSDMSVAGRLTTVANTLLSQYIDEDGVIAGLQRLLITESQRFPDLAEQVIGSARKVRVDSLTALFDQMAAEGLIEPDDSHLSAELFFDVVVGSSAYHMMIGYQHTLPSQADIALRVDAFLHGRVKFR
jgi:AcrR family transcriptional regulator